MLPALVAIVMLCSWFICRKVHIPAVPINHISQYVMWCVLVAGYLLNLFWFWKMPSLVCRVQAAYTVPGLTHVYKMGILAQMSWSASSVP